MYDFLQSVNGSNFFVRTVSGVDYSLTDMTEINEEQHFIKARDLSTGERIILNVNAIESIILK